MEKQLKEIFLSALDDFEESDITDDLAAEEIEAWDSMMHLMIITAIEETFNVHIDEEKIPELNTFKKIKEELKALIKINS